MQKKMKLTEGKTIEEMSFEKQPCSVHLLEFKANFFPFCISSFYQKIFEILCSELMYVLALV